MDLERLAIAIALVLVGFAVYRLYGWLSLRRIEVKLEAFKPGKPAIVYFTDPGCTPCLLVQDPALEEIAARHGEQVQLIKVQALERPDLTDSWGVLSLPTTFIIDGRGRPRGVNHGVARAPKLLDQLATIDEAFILTSETGTIDSLS